jgi:2-methylcitrate dehydratase PrpD
MRQWAQSPRGLSASTVVLEDQQGYVNALFGNDFDWDVLLSGLGSNYEILDPGFSIKRYPAEIYMQWVIEAASMLRERDGLDPSTIEAVVIDPPTLHLDLSRPAPKSGLDGKFSYEYCTAVGLFEDRVSINSFTDEVRFLPGIEALLTKITIEHTPGKTRQDPWAGIRVVTASGSVHEMRCDAYRGSIANPMSVEDHQQKVLDCFRSVGKEDLGDEAVAAVGRLDREDESLETLLGILRRI